MNVERPNDDAAAGVSAATANVAAPLSSARTQEMQRAAQAYQRGRSQAVHSDDQVSVSRTASELSHAVSDTSSLARMGMTLSTEHLESLRQAVKSGTLPFDAISLAAAIMREA